MNSKFIPAATVAALLIVLELVAYNHASDQTLAVSGGAAAAAADVLTLKSRGGCSGCFSEADNGRTLTISETSRITIELPKALYDENSLQVTPVNILGQTFGATAAPGDFVKTLEAIAPGTASVSFAPVKSGGKPYRLTVKIMGALPPPWGGASN